MSRFIDHGDGTVTDTQTGLMWTKATVADNVDNTTAEKACKNLDTAGNHDWALPTVEQLFVLADRSRHNPAIDTEAFPDTKSDWYWTSTPCAWAPSCAWFVLFYYGYAHDYLRSGYACVRAVRSVSAGQ